MGSLVERLSTIIEIDRKLRRKIELIDELGGLIAFLQRNLVCDPYTEYYCPSFHMQIPRLEKWMEYLEALNEKGKENALRHYSIKPRIDYDSLELHEICLESDVFDCIYVDAKLPLSDKDLEKIRERVKNKIMSLVDNIPFVYTDLLISIKMILPEIKHELDQLRKDYLKLKQELEKVIK